MAVSERMIAIFRDDDDDDDGEEMCQKRKKEILFLAF